MSSIFLHDMTEYVKSVLLANKMQHEQTKRQQIESIHSLLSHEILTPIGIITQFVDRAKSLLKGESNIQ